MRYKISYENKPTVNVKSSRLITNNSVKYIILGVVILAVLAGGLRTICNSNNSDNTKQALNNMVSNLKNGDSIGEAMNTFCWEILNDTDVQG